MRRNIDHAGDLNETITTLGNPVDTFEVVRGGRRGADIRACQYLVSLRRVSGCFWRFGIHGSETSPKSPIVVSKYVRDSRKT